jgi:uncharacterized protein (TIGR02246 family)
MSRRSLLALALIVLGMAVALGHAAAAMQADAIIALERGALDRWGRGDPQGYLELYARDVTYFDPWREKRIDGLEAMQQALEPIKGLIKVDRYEMIAPHVRRAGDIAILTYNLVSHGLRPDGSEIVTRWNSTAVYGQVEGRWKILHSHWSYTKPELKVPGLR